VLADIMTKISAGISAIPNPTTPSPNPGG